MRGFKLSAFAVDDVFDALSYTYDKWGGEQMRKYEGLLEHGRDLIRQDPYLLGSKSRNDLLTGCRLYKVEHHYVFYRLNEGDNTVEIARILHEKRDFVRHVGEKHFPE